MSWRSNRIVSRRIRRFSLVGVELDSHFMAHVANGGMLEFIFFGSFVPTSATLLSGIASTDGVVSAAVGAAEVVKDVREHDFF